MKTLSHARQLAMKSLFAMSLAGADVDETLAFLQEEESVSKETVEIARELARGAFDRVEQLDRIIESHLLRWDFSRIGNVEKAILRLAGFELWCSSRIESPQRVPKQPEARRSVPVWIEVWSNPTGQIDLGQSSVVVS